MSIFSPRPRHFQESPPACLHETPGRCCGGAAGAVLTLSAEPNPPKASLHLFAAGCAVLEVIGGAVAADNLLAWLVAKHLDENGHGEAADYADAKDADHGQVAPPVLVRAGGRVLGPPRVQCVGGRDAAQVSQPGDKRRSGCDTDLAMAALEDLVRPGHADWHRRAQTEAYHEQASVTGPRVLQCEGDGQKPGDLDEHSAREEDGPKPVEAVRDGSDNQDGKEVHDPDGRKQQADLDAGVRRVDGGDDDVAVELGADTDAHDAKVHQHQRPETPVDQDIA